MNGEKRLPRIKKVASDIGKTGQTLSATGDFIGNNSKSELAKNVATKMQNYGSVLQNGSNTATSVLNAPQNYFKGFANQNIGNGLTKAGEYLAGRTGLAGSIGTGLQNLSTSMTASGAGATAGAAGGATAGATGASAGGAAAGGAAAGGSAASGAAAAGPIGALVALGAMAIQGTNRKRAKQTGQALLNSTNQIASQEADNALAQTQQYATAQQQALGQYGLGNIDLYNRPQVKMDDGKTATVRSMSFNDGNNEVLIPTVSDDGRILSNDEAIKNYYKTGRYLGKFNSVDEANKYAEQLHNEQDSYYNGVTTGGAAPTQDEQNTLPPNYPQTKQQFAQSLRDNGWDDNTINSALNGLNLGNKDMDNYINSYNYYGAKDGEQITIPKTNEEIAAARASLQNSATPETQQQQGKIKTDYIKQSILDKFINGITDFSKGYQENRNTAFTPNNLKQSQFVETIQKPNEQLLNYQNQLREQGYDENIVNAVAEGKNSGNKDIATWINNNPAALKPETDTIYTDKSKMARLGEAAGTLGRFVQKPAAQALIAGSLSTALTGNPLYGLGMANKFGNQRQRTELYQDALKKQGVNVDDLGMFGTLNNTDFNALMTPQYKDAVNNIAMAKLKETENYHNLLMKHYNDKLEETRDYHGKSLNIQQQNANSNAIRAKNSGKNSKTPEPQEHQDWNNDLSGFYTLYTDPRYADKVDIAKSRFINKYGVDPTKYINL